MKEKIRDILLFLLLFEILYFYDEYIYVGGFGIGLPYLGCIAVMILCFFSFLNTPRVEDFLSSVKMTGLLSLPYVFNIIISLGIWIFSFVSIRQMITGFFEPVYVLLALMAAGSLYYVWGGKLVNYTFWAVSLAFSCVVAIEINLVGIGEFLRQFFVLLSSNATETGRAMKHLEDPRYSYVYTYFIIYFLYHRKEEGTVKYAVKMAVSILFFLLGLKRICELSLAAGLMLSFVYSKCRESIKKYLTGAFIAGFILFSAVYVPVVRYGLFNQLVQNFHIDTSARDTIYGYYAEYYEISPSYMGRGLGWVKDYRRDLKGLERFNVHCEYVKNYIEMGFWGYLVWMWTVVPGILTGLVKRKRPRGDAVIFGVLGAYSVFMVTENIFNFYMSSLVMGVILMVCSGGGNQEEVEHGLE